jgi:hypothetical protein
MLVVAVDQLNQAELVELVDKEEAVMVEDHRILMLQVMELMQLVGVVVLADILSQSALNQAVSVVPVL